MSFVPDDFKIPLSLECQNFRLRKLMYADALLDYEAVMSSQEIIRKTRGGLWPDAALTYEDDQIDLAWHQREFEHRSSFAYTVMSRDEKECLGCVYLYPPGTRHESSAAADVDASFWVTQKAYDAGLYDVLFKELDVWLKSAWSFKNIGYTNSVLPKV